MTLALIGAGLPRTGTSSLREALRLLLGAPVYHMSELLARPEHVGAWVAAIGGTAQAWDPLLAGYVAGVDFPFSNCWRQLAAAHPSAPVLLSHRGDAHVWLASMEATVLPRVREVLAAPSDPVAPLFRVMFGEVADDLADREALLAGYRRWNDDVRAGVSPSRLVEWQPGDGWEPICRALGRPLPPVPFPHVNSREEYRARREDRSRRDRHRRGEEAD